MDKEETQVFNEVFGAAMKDPKIRKAYEAELKRLQRLRGSKGGKQTKKRHGVQHFSRISKKRWRKK